MLTKLDETKFDTVYALLEESFPPDERRTYEGQKALLGNARYTIYSYEENGEIRAAMLCWDLGDVLFLEHFAVCESQRNRGLGGKLLAALSRLSGKRICLETEPPETDIAKRRIAFYERNGFSLNSYPYVQPPLSQGKQAVPLQIMTTGGPVDVETFENIKNKLYKQVYQKGCFSMELYVKNYRGEGISDSDAIDKCLAEAAKAEGTKTIILDGEDYYLDRAILVSDNMEIIVDGCMLKQKKHVFDNIFRSANFIVNPEDPYNVPLEVKPTKNVKILGRNGASIYGTAWPKVGYHPFFEQDQLMVGDFWGYRTHMFNFALADNLEIGGFLLRQTMGWALSFESSSNIHIHDLEIHSHVKNGDGIDFRSGCHHCLVENISGTTSDDTVACTALAKKEYPNPMPPGKGVYPGEPYHRLVPCDDRDIHDITIKNVTSGGRMHGVIVLAANGNKVYNIDIQDIVEDVDGARQSTVKIYTGYGTGYTKGDIHDIRLKNIRSKIADYAVMVDAEVENVTLEEIYQDNPEGELVTGI